jgi:hypothetical protein
MREDGPYTPFLWHCNTLLLQGEEGITGLLENVLWGSLDQTF